MGLRIRKSIKLAPGLRLNIGKKSSSISVGGKGITYNAKLYGGTKKKSRSAAPSSAAHEAGQPAQKNGCCLGSLLFWLFIGWWWWPIRLVCYDLPKAILKALTKKSKKPEA